MDKKKVIVILFIVVTGFLVIGIARRDIILPKNIRYLVYLARQINPPKDLYNPIVIDHFKFYEKGFSKTYNLKPKYYDIYVFGISAEKKELTSKYQFSGKIKLELFSDNKLISEQIATKIDTAWYLNNDLQWYKKIVLSSFEIPLSGKHTKDIKLKATVLEPDLALRDKESVKLYVGVSATP